MMDQKESIKERRIYDDRRKFTYTVYFPEKRSVIKRSVMDRRDAISANYALNVA
jgi:hypothetical protein